MNEFLDTEKLGKLQEAIFKKAIGYATVSRVDEMAPDADGELSIVKRKVTYKDTEPNVGAAKMLLDRSKSTDEYSTLSDEELERERLRLLKELERTNNKYE